MGNVKKIRFYFVWFLKLNVEIIKTFYESDLLGAIGFIFYAMFWMGIYFGLTELYKIIFNN